MSFVGIHRSIKTDKPSSFTQTVDFRQAAKENTQPRHQQLVTPIVKPAVESNHKTIANIVENNTEICT